MASFCQRCGKEQSAQALFCPDCGQRLSAAEDRTTAPPVQPQAARAQGPGAAAGNHEAVDEASPASTAPLLGTLVPAGGTGLPGLAAAVPTDGTPGDAPNVYRSDGGERPVGNGPNESGTNESGTNALQSANGPVPEGSGAPVLGGPPRRVKGCPFCLWKIVDVAPEDIRTCRSCGSQYHPDCYEDNGGCAVFGCPEWTTGQMAAAVAVNGQLQVASPAVGFPPAAVPLQAPVLAPTAAAPMWAWAPPTAPPEPAPTSAAATPTPAGLERNFCPSCGERLGAEYVFCGYCGARNE